MMPQPLDDEIALSENENLGYLDVRVDGSSVSWGMGELSFPITQVGMFQQSSSLLFSLKVLPRAL
jgi:hypothetical protein